MSEGNELDITAVLAGGQMKGPGVVEEKSVDFITFLFLKSTTWVIYEPPLLLYLCSLLLHSKSHHSQYSRIDMYCM
jgi:hypothetical protein